MRILPLLFLLLACVACQQYAPINSKTIVDIDTQWEFAEEGTEEYLPASVPGLVHLDLFANGQIDDPYWEDNEIKQRWIEEKNWTYRTDFEVSAPTLANEKVFLRFDGLDTYGDVFLNGSKVLSANNMFRSWEVNVKSLLVEGLNKLEVHFKSPILRNKQQVMEYPHRLPSGNEPADIPVKVASFTRKAAYQFGWDWGPRFVSQGIWKPVSLVTWNKARIINASTQTSKLDQGYAYLESLVEIEASEAGSYNMQIGDSLFQVDLSIGMNEIRQSFKILDPIPWWTNGRGKSHLYDQLVVLRSGDVLLDSITNTFGVRTIELVNEADSIGTAFYFKLNGERIFIKGANYIPQDLFLTRVSDDQYETLILAAKEANMNMLRVWGGGVYEKDLFYDLCDRHGILVWQDFMFAGSLYPDNPEFNENVEAEVLEIIKRLRGHPCLALWCGNNEIEVAWKNWGWQKQFDYNEKDSTSIWMSYATLFQKRIPALLEKHHPMVAYTSTTPMSNWGAAENFNHSTMHYWGVWHGREPFENFETNVGRFMVEYGFQSYPELSTLQNVMADSHFNLDDSLMVHRQKSYIGNGLISAHIRQYFDEPMSFSQFVEKSQETQALGLRKAIKAHINKAPHCMGTLIWQLNDCWPGPSWSIIDYFGKKKKAFYTVKEEFD